MNTTRRITMLVAATAVISTAAGGWALAAEPPQPQQPPAAAPHMGGEMPMGQGMMGQGMMGQGMMGQGMMGRGMMGHGGMADMMGMMEQCPKMMGGTGAQGAMMPRLPPGNDKLQLEMQAEIMQKVGEILGRYASRIEVAR